MLSEDKNFNFWPSFADLMLTLVLVLILILAFTILNFNKFKTTVSAASTTTISSAPTASNFSVTSTTATDNTIQGYKLPEYQQIVIDGLKNYFDENDKSIILKQPIKNEYGDTVTDFSNNLQYLIRIISYADHQKLMFSDQILFRSGADDLLGTGTEILNEVGNIITSRNLAEKLKELQIQGNADTDKLKNGGSNLELAYRRAAKVYNYLKDVKKINPSDILMSVTSFGEYNSVQRSENPDVVYNEAKLKSDNEDKNQKDLNRRIEILLFYKKGVLDLN